MLQLLRCRVSLKDFHFVTPPDKQTVDEAFKLLLKFGCVKGNQKDPIITELGETYAELPLAPRLSHFVILACSQHDELDLAASIAAIVSAPQSIFVDSSDPQKKNQTKERIAEMAQLFSSDLFFLYQTMCDWMRAGPGLSHMCECLGRHDKPVSIGCSVCRSEYAAQNGLNFHMLEHILKTRDVVLKIISRTLKSIDVAPRSRRRTPPPSPRRSSPPLGRKSPPPLDAGPVAAFASPVTTPDASERWSDSPPPLPVHAPMGAAGGSRFQSYPSVVDGTGVPPFSLESMHTPGPSAPPLPSASRPFSRPRVPIGDELGEKVCCVCLSAPQCEE